MQRGQLGEKCRQLRPALARYLVPSPAPLASNGQALPKGQADIFKRKMPFWEALSNYPGHT